MPNLHFQTESNREKTSPMADGNYISRVDKDQPECGERRQVNNYKLGHGDGGSGAPSSSVTSEILMWAVSMDVPRNGDNVGIPEVSSEDVVLTVACKTID